MALKVAILERSTQRRVAASAGIHEVRLSNIICGVVTPLAREKRVLARVLRRSQAVLFPQPAESSL